MRKVDIVGPPPVQVLDVTGPLEVFSNAPDYEIRLANRAVNELFRPIAASCSPTQLPSSTSTVPSIGMNFLRERAARQTHLLVARRTSERRGQRSRTLVASNSQRTTNRFPRFYMILCLDTNSTTR